MPPNRAHVCHAVVNGGWAPNALTPSPPGTSLSSRHRSHYGRCLDPAIGPNQHPVTHIANIRVCCPAADLQAAVKAAIQGLRVFFAAAGQDGELAAAAGRAAKRQKVQPGDQGAAASHLLINSRI